NKMIANRVHKDRMISKIVVNRIRKVKICSKIITNKVIKDKMGNNLVKKIILKEKITVSQVVKNRTISKVIIIRLRPKIKTVNKAIRRMYRVKIHNKTILKKILTDRTLNKVMVTV